MYVNCWQIYTWREDEKDPKALCFLIDKYHGLGNYHYNGITLSLWSANDLKEEVKKLNKIKEWSADFTTGRVWNIAPLIDVHKLAIDRGEFVVYKSLENNKREGR